MISWFKYLVLVHHIARIIINYNLADIQGGRPSDKYLIVLHLV